MHSAPTELYRKLGYQELMTIPGYYSIQGRPADGYLYAYYLNNGRPFSSSCHSYIRRYVVETVVCQAAICAYETAMIFTRRARGTQTRTLTCTLAIVLLLMVLVFLYSKYGGV